MFGTGYDRETDAIFVWFGPEDEKSTHAEEVAPGILRDFDAGGRVSGIEVIGIDVLDVGERMKDRQAAA